MKKTIIVSWGESITRSHSIAKLMDFDDLHIVPKYSGFFGKFFNYLSSAFIQFVALLNGGYERVVVVSPPVFLIYVAFLSRCFLRKKFEIYIDCHNGVLRNEWLGWPILNRLVRRADCVFSHNNVVKIRIDSAFSISSKVLTDPLVADLPAKVDVSRFLKPSAYNVLVPVSYAADEPIAEIVDAAKKLGAGFNLILTGNYRKKFKDVSSIPITFTGFVSKEEYYSLMADVDAVLCLTKNEDIQMCALIEAISLDKKIVASNNPVNNKLFLEFVSLLANNDADSISTAVIKLTNQHFDNFKLVDARANYSQKWMMEALNVFK